MEYPLTVEELSVMAVRESELRALRKDNELLKKALAIAHEHLSYVPPRCY